MGYVVMDSEQVRELRKQKGGDEQAGPRRRGGCIGRDGQEGRARGAGDVPYRAGRG